MISNDKLDSWISQKLNVLLIGKHGVGKTSIIRSAFDRHNLKYLYFSAPTMDPWVDFVGIPKEQKDENGNSFLSLVRPKELQNDEIDAVVFDEFNRAPKKVKNACMEFMQFKSINGKKFNNLKFVWAAINPDDEEDGANYDVEKMDAAQLDRFHVIKVLPYKPDLKYFADKYGENGKVAVSWWDRLAKESKNILSPRRLDYALSVFTNGGDVRDVLSSGINVSSLMQELKMGPINDIIAKLSVVGNPDEIIKFIQDKNNFNSAKDIITKSKYIGVFLPHLRQEDFNSLVASNKHVLSHVLLNMGMYESKSISLVNAGLNSTVSSKLKKAINDFNKQIKVSSTNDITNNDINTNQLTSSFPSTLISLPQHPAMRPKKSRYFNGHSPNALLSSILLGETIKRVSERKFGDYFNTTEFRIQVYIHIYDLCVTGVLLHDHISKVLPVVVEIYQRSNSSSLPKLYKIEFMIQEMIKHLKTKYSHISSAVVSDVSKLLLSCKKRMSAGCLLRLYNHPDFNESFDF